MKSPSPFGLQDIMNRRLFLGRSAAALGSIALASLMGDRAFAGAPKADTNMGGLADFPNFAPKAKRVIYLFQSGAPSQMDLFDPKPQLLDKRGENLPDTIRKGQRLTTM